CYGRGVHDVGRQTAALTDTRNRLYESLSYGGCLSIWNWCRLSLVCSLDFQEALHRVRLLIVVNHYVVGRTHQDKIAVGVTLHVGLASAIARTPGPDPKSTPLN